MPACVNRRTVGSQVYFDRSILLGLGPAGVAVVGHAHHLSLSATLRIHLRGDIMRLLDSDDHPTQPTHRHDGDCLEGGESWARLGFVASGEGRLRLARAWGPAAGEIRVARGCIVSMYVPILVSG